MKDINCVNLIGRLTRNAEMKETTNSHVVNFSLAYNRRIYSAGSYSEKANFIECQIFGNRGKNIYHLLKKGAQVVIEGELDHQTWQSKDNSKKSRHVIHCREVQLCGNKQIDDSHYKAYPGNSLEEHKKLNQQQQPTSTFTDDFPF